MNDAPNDNASDSGLYVSDAEIARRLGFCEKTGYRIIRQLDMPNRARRPYPARDPLFGGRRFWPAVLQWHMDYHHVRTERAQIEQPMWEENFNETPGKAERPRRARPQLATA